MEISVYISSYNQKSVLGEAIESVLTQSVKPHQIIIVDDASVDGSQELISAYYSRYQDIIQPIYHELNMGISYSRAEALKHVTGDYVTYVDGDDRFLPGKIESELDTLLRNPHADIAFSNVRYTDWEGNQQRIWVEETPPPQGSVFCETFSRNYPKGNLFRVELVNYHAWKQIGFHDPYLRDLYEDYDMRIRMTKRLETTYCEKINSEYRQHDKGLSRANYRSHFRALDYIFKKNLYLLRDIERHTRKETIKRTKEWIAGVASRAIADCIAKGQIREALLLLPAAWRYGPAIASKTTVSRIAAKIKSNY